MTVVDLAESRAVLARWPAPLDALGPAERARAAALRRARDRDDFVAAHLLARECVGRLAGAPAGAVAISQRCERCGGPHGRPRVDDPPRAHVSWSHADGWAMAAASARPVGVDAEHRHALDPIGDVLARVGTPAEAAQIAAAPDPAGAFLRMWTAKEALVKAGAMTLDDIGAVAVRDLAGHRVHVAESAGLVTAVAVRGG